jgi:hypothetical protein
VGEWRGFSRAVRRRRVWLGKGRRNSSTSSGLSASPGAAGAGAGASHGLVGVQVPEGGCWVTVVDLAPLWSRRESEMGTREPEKVAEFLVSKDKHVAELQFSSDGCAVVVVPRDEQVAQMFQLRLGPSVGKVVGDVGVVKKGKRVSVGVVAAAEREPWHVCDLKRGRTSAVVEAVECADDRRWVAFATRKRTVHVFPVNPYGGKSHSEGQVRNVDELVSNECFFCSRPLIGYLYSIPCPWKSARLLDFASRDSWYQPRSFSCSRLSTLPNPHSQPSHSSQHHGHLSPAFHLVGLFISCSTYFHRLTAAGEFPGCSSV